MDKVNCQGWSLVLVRLVLGGIFFLHGAQKVFGWFDGPGLERFVEWIGAYGVSEHIAYLAAFAELIGGILLLVGRASRIGALMVLLVMLGAIFIVHWPHGFFLQNQGFEYPLVLALCALAVLIGGPGRCALPKMG